MVDSLFSEYTNLKGVIQRLEELATQRDALVRLSDDSLQQARQVIGDTETTLKQLHNRIRKIFRGGNENNGVSSFSLRCRFLWNEREVEAMMQRLRARQQSLSLVLQLWSKSASLGRQHSKS